MNLEVKIISFKSNPSSLEKLKKYFPNTQISKAIDMRNYNPLNLYKKNLITITGYRNLLLKERKWHHELTSTGCVGLHQSVLKTLKKRNGWILLCEEDCNPNDNLPKNVNLLINLYNKYKFDIIIFGPVLTNNKYENINIPEFENFRKIITIDSFFHTHCVLYSPRGRRKMIKYLKQPQEVQLDSYISFLGYINNLTVLLEFNTKSASQEYHISTIQNNNLCILCYFNELGLSIGSLSFIFLIIIIISLIVYIKFKKF